MHVREGSYVMYTVYTTYPYLHSWSGGSTQPVSEKTQHNAMLAKYTTKLTIMTLYTGVHTLTATKEAVNPSQHID